MQIEMDVIGCACMIVPVYVLRNSQRRLRAQGSNLLFSVATPLFPTSSGSSVLCTFGLRGNCYGRLLG